VKPGSGNDVYSHSKISLNEVNNIEVMTDTALDETFYLEGYYDDTTCHNFFKDNYKRKEIKVVVDDPCPSGTVKFPSTMEISMTKNLPVSATEPYRYYPYELERNADIFDTANKYASAPGVVNIWASSDTARCSISNREVYLATDTNNPIA
jgi:hypothetical protein